MKRLRKLAVEWLACRFIGHAWRNEVVYVAGFRCSGGPQCARCNAVPHGAKG